MKKNLITGLNSYLGTSLEKSLKNYPGEYVTESISLRDNQWREKDFSGFDVVFHVAGIAHIKETKENAELYYTVNRDLAYETAKKVKSEGVKQFIFLSSMSVYGIESGVINKHSQTTPKSNYGKSKLQAEELIKSLSDEHFKIAIVRPPMIYGYGCKGNYPRLANLVLKLPIFPDIANERSMIYIVNLCEFIKLLIDEDREGLFFPQNKEYVCTSEMVKLIVEVHGRRIWMTKLFNPILRLLMTSIFKKVFGDLVLEKNLSIYNEQYNKCSFLDSIANTEKGEING